MHDFVNRFLLSQEDINLLHKNTITKTFIKNTEINNECLGFIKVIRGELRAYILTENAKEITIFTLKENDECIICSQCNLNSMSYDIFIQSTENTQISIIPADFFAYLKSKYPQINDFALNLIVKRFNTLIKVLEQALFTPLVQRICNFLKENAKNNLIKITHEELANHLGSAREAVSRILKELEKEGKIKLNRKEILLISL